MRPPSTPYTEADFIPPTSRDPYPRGRVIQRDDTPAMRQALLRLLRQKIRFRRVSASQLKVGRINFYPNTRTLMCDGRIPKRNSSLEEFIALIQHASRHGDPSISRHVPTPSPETRPRLAIDNTTDRAAVGPKMTTRNEDPAT